MIQVNDYLYLVRAIVNRGFRYPDTECQLEDMEQDGIIGLIDAINHFDPNNGTKFSTYAKWYIRGAIIKGLKQRQRQEEQLITDADIAYNEIEISHKMTELINRPDLTNNQRQLLQYLVDGIADTDIADAFGITTYQLGWRKRILFDYLRSSCSSCSE